MERINRLPTSKQVRLQVIGTAKPPIQRLCQNDECQVSYMITPPKGYVPSARCIDGCGQMYACLWDDGRNWYVGRLRMHRNQLFVQYNDDEKGRVAREMHELKKLRFELSKVLKGSLVAHPKKVRR